MAGDKVSWEIQYVTYSSGVQTHTIIPNTSQSQAVTADGYDLGTVACLNAIDYVLASDALYLELEYKNGVYPGGNGIISLMRNVTIERTTAQ